MKTLNTILIFILFFFLNIFIFPSVSHSTKFTVQAFPSGILDDDMDCWYKVSPNTSPIWYLKSHVYKDQIFQLLVLFSGYSVDKNNNANLRYDVQIYNPKDNPTDDKGINMLGHEGPIKKGFLILNKQGMKFEFTEEYLFGIYKIRVTAYDKVSGETAITEMPMKLIPFEPPEKFESEGKAIEWLYKYYTNPTPIKAISAVQKIIKTDPKLMSNNLGFLLIFRKIFLDNKFLLKHIAKHFDSFSEEDQKKFSLISGVCEDLFLISSIDKLNKKELKKIYNDAKQIQFPNISGEIKTEEQLSGLLANFIATGKYEPVRKMVSILSFGKYSGTLAKVKAGKIKATKKVYDNLYLEKLYDKTVNFLIRFCETRQLFFNYCVFMYNNEILDENIKKQLGAILHIVQERKQGKKTKTK